MANTINTDQLDYLVPWNLLMSYHLRDGVDTPFDEALARFVDAVTNQKKIIVSEITFQQDTGGLIFSAQVVYAPNIKKARQI